MLLTREWVTLAIFFSILAALVTIALITKEKIDPEIERKIFTEIKN